MTEYASHPRANFDYEILETIEAGLQLTGQEVKSLKAGRGSLEGARVMLAPDGAWLVGANIPAYQPKNAPDFDPERPRRLLLSREELKSLVGQGKTKRLTIIPLSVYNKGRFIKAGVALVRGKRQYDKRETIKKRDVERDLNRSLKN